MDFTKPNKLNLTSIKDLSQDALFEILKLTKSLKKNPHLKAKTLDKKVIALIFAKPSLRTRVSFEVGIHELGGYPITLKMDEISVGIRENVEDIGNVLSKYVNAVVIRTFDQKEVEELGKYSSVTIINGLINEEHPCQVISDIFTILEIFKSLNGLKLAYVGDGNNIAQSLLLISALAGLNISIACPKNHKPSNYYIETAKKLNKKINIEITTSPKIAVKNANVIYTDVWTSMGKEKETEKRKKIFTPYQVNDALLIHAAKNTVVLHCLPAHKEQEISSNVFNKFSEIIYRQAENRLHAQKAILLKLLGK